MYVGTSTYNYKQIHIIYVHIHIGKIESCLNLSCIANVCRNVAKSRTRRDTVSLVMQSEEESILNLVQSQTRKSCTFVHFPCTIEDATPKGPQMQISVRIHRLKMGFNWHRSNAKKMQSGQGGAPRSISQGRSDYSRKMHRCNFSVYHNDVH